MIPVCANGQFAVYDSVLTEVLLPVTGEPSDHHPTSIVRAASIYAVDEEAAFPRGFFDSEEVPWLGCYVTPGIFSQFIELEPVHVV